MKQFTRWIAVLLAAAVFAPFSAQAGVQQDRMKNCSKQYRDQNIPKNQHRAFMAQCLKKDAGSTAAAPAVAKPAAATAAPAAAPVAAKASQQNKMKECNANAKSQSLKGAARKDFMKNCLSGAAAAPAK
ncbi:MAG: hypothetical protein COS39_02975 [Hydrogenophilales bacterium CG03_land_8_20_14_0_80_62_28]|nr:hypothetical protein [Betaproteobacteria bacterium]OIO78052.1 MAG: hypothetical protein AUJ86_06650 [Hydrogenophilaceae bacterium CG1_02_62_390]PIV23841.1 MAG: hypothetical protein COS39_02975 [Hydrogenophilales bacterium CG03_land_8_20_14_0_80_62_28]PIW37838.1 MAG: hypothetical protein COW23_09685 [Hydrogenophilales bacterium CG15_BIG_FIL_POST_REV_8_21_14_020_62_31]PIW72395.1 MAG: hypothetical protein COW07_03205 [Hydrogenophilales bacterium CG12_big_fil_rev_8_21_14_0_65_61_21]PIX01740.1 M